LDNDISCRHQDSFACHWQLIFVEDKISSKDKYTHRVDSTGSYSMIDHFAISQKLIVDSANHGLRGSATRD